MADPTTIDGIFNIDKPEGMTSHDVVARIRRLLRFWIFDVGFWSVPPGAVQDPKSGVQQPVPKTQNPTSKIQNRVGHAGTLDPMATGVLPIVVGKATRLVEYLSDADKAYRATIMLGATSDTYDREGTLTPVSPQPTVPSPRTVEDVLDHFRGEIQQMPPMHSAIKMGGKKLYELARKGIEVERQPRHVTISRLDIEAYRPPVLQVFVECSKGTYIRSLAHDIGQALGTGAYLAALVRTRHGPFTLQGATTLEGLEAAFHEGTWQESLYPPSYILQGWPTHAATPAEERDILQGKPLPLRPPAEGQPTMLAATTQDGALLAILYWRDEPGLWWPRKVLRGGEDSGVHG